MLLISIVLATSFFVCRCQRPVSCAVAVILSFSEKDPSLEIKYRPKKNKQKKEMDAEREEKSDRDESCTPPPKTDRRRGSQVRERPGGSYCARLFCFCS